MTFPIILFELNEKIVELFFYQLLMNIEMV